MNIQMTTCHLLKWTFKWTLFNASADILGRHESLPAEENLEKKSNLKICVG